MISRSYPINNHEYANKYSKKDKGARRRLYGCLLLVSRVLYCAGHSVHHLSSPAVAHGVHRSTLPATSVQPGRLFFGCPKTQGLLDLSAREVYLACYVTAAPVGSYPTFSPLPRLGRGGIFSAALAVLYIQDAKTFLLGSTITLCCPDFPPCVAARR